MQDSLSVYIAMWQLKFWLWNNNTFTHNFMLGKENRKTVAIDYTDTLDILLREFIRVETMCVRDRPNTNWWALKDNIEVLSISLTFSLTER